MTNARRDDQMVRTTLDNGAVAPEVVLPAGPAQSWALRDFRGKGVVLVFYPADWEAVSTDQLRHYNEILPQIWALDAELAGLSVDGISCHQAFARALRLDFPLLSDFRPRGAAARAYGVYRPREGTSGRALFVVDAAGLIRWHYLAPPEVNPGVDGMLTALEELAHEKG